MQASKVTVGEFYVYCPGQKAKFDYWWSEKNLSQNTIWKVEVLQRGVERYSGSTGRYVNNGIKVRFVGTCDVTDGLQNASKDRTAIITANRLKMRWTGTIEDYFKDELLAHAERRKRTHESLQQRQTQIALTQYQQQVLDEEKNDLLDILEANSFCEDEYEINRYERGVVLRGDGIKRLIEILGA